MIHIGAKDRGMNPQDKDPDSLYRTMLWVVGHVRSAADLDSAGRQAILRHLKAQGWKSQQKGHRGRQSKRGGTPQSRLIHHIWNCLDDADVVHNRDGLGTWLQTNTKKEHPQGIGWKTPEFLPVKVKNRVIEQLKKWAAREGVKWE
ncbi:MAG: regulatory protein GemA [gamma proteobacterium endosymbiont of Lamellibrachia anaximandri]|nr:regulatory protein GemA [gamma proteobacterium endosymbiont of Lamellibrachia anaximandri]